MGTMTGPLAPRAPSWICAATPTSPCVRIVAFTDLSSPTVIVPVPVAEVFTGSPGKFVTLKDTIRGFKAIVNGEYDHLPEQAFYMIGAIEEAVEKAKSLQ